MMIVFIDHSNIQPTRAHTHTSSASERAQTTKGRSTKWRNGNLLPPVAFFFSNELSSLWLCIERMYRGEIQS